jgi:5-methyltetrahydrofolate--homocysteine methyltransferase
MADVKMEALTGLRQAVVDGEADVVRDLAQQALAGGIDPMEAINEGLIPGITEVGRRFERKEYFLPELMMAADAMKKGMEVLEGALGTGGGRRQSLATVVLGTVKGDIHDIGKSIVGTILSAHGYDVVDLGVDVAVAKFVDTAVAHQAQVVAMSALLPTTMPVMKRVIDELTERGIRNQFKVIVGGAPVTPDYARQIGADGYGDDAIAAVRLLHQLLGA